jgi:predicted Na+-dependent transporter
MDIIILSVSIVTSIVIVPFLLGLFLYKVLAYSISLKESVSIFVYGISWALIPFYILLSKIPSSTGNISEYVSGVIVILLVFIVLLKLAASLNRGSENRKRLMLWGVLAILPLLVGLGLFFKVLYYILGGKYV